MYLPLDSVWSALQILGFSVIWMMIKSLVSDDHNTPVMLYCQETEDFLNFPAWLQTAGLYPALIGVDYE